MKHLFLSLTILGTMTANATTGRLSDNDDLRQLAAVERQVVDYLVDKHVEYETVYDAAAFGLPAPDSLRLKTDDGMQIFAYEICPARPKAVIICLSGIENPSVTAYYGHAAHFYREGIATIMPDLRGHGRSDGNRICLAYEETHDVKAVTDYIKSKTIYRGLPVIVMGVSMGGGVAIRATGENQDIDALISLSAFSSLEDFLRTLRQAYLPNIPEDKLDAVTAIVIKDKYGVDSRLSSPLHALRGLDNRPVLLMHSRQDSQVPFICYERLLAEARHYTKTIDTFTVDGDEHFICHDFTKPSDNADYLDKIMHFVRQVVKTHKSHTEP